METQSKSLKWWNSIGSTQRMELSLEYYSCDLVLDEEIERIYLDQHRYYIEFDGKKKFLCVFPIGEEQYNADFKTLNEALDYMLITCSIAEVTIKN